MSKRKRHNRNFGFATRAIHHGYDPRDENGALNPPIYMTSTFAFESAKDGGEMFAGEREGYIYSRLGNPTQNLLETRMAELEGAEAALATASGMGAISATLWTLVEPGDELIVDKTLYGCTFSFFTHGLRKFGVTVTPVDLTVPENLVNALNEKTRVVYFETPANPNMRLIDIANMRKIVDDSLYSENVTLVVDNTYCTPYLQSPLAEGADLVIHSATKYLGGHGDLVAGIVAGPFETMQSIRMHGLKDMTGAVLSAMDAFLVLRGLKTLEVRMDRHIQNAQAIANLLEDHPLVENVYYPGVKSFKHYDITQRQMRGPGGMMAFELKGGMEAGTHFMDALDLVIRAVSLGDAETLVQHPASMTHSTYTREERLVHGISDGLIRLSAGLETTSDLLEDIDQALTKTNSFVTKATKSHQSA